MRWVWAGSGENSAFAGWENLEKGAENGVLSFQWCCKSCSTPHDGESPVSSFQQSGSAVLADKMVDESEVPLIRERLSQDGQLNLDDLHSFDESPSPDVYGRNVSLSLADAAFIDTRCISRLLALHRRFRQEGGKLVVHSIRPRAMGLLKFLRLHLVFHIAEDEAAALQLLRAGETVGAEC